MSEPIAPTSPDPDYSARPIIRHVPLPELEALHRTITKDAGASNGVSPDLLDTGSDLQQASC